MTALVAYRLNPSLGQHIPLRIVECVKLFSKGSDVGQSLKSIKLMDLPGDYDTSDDTNPGPNHVYISSDKCLVDKIDNIHISKQSSDTYGILLRELDGWILIGGSLFYYPFYPRFVRSSYMSFNEIRAIQKATKKGVIGTSHLGDYFGGFLLFLLELTRILCFYTGDYGCWLRIR